MCFYAIACLSYFVLVSSQSLFVHLDNFIAKRDANSNAVTHGAYSEETMDMDEDNYDLDSEDNYDLDSEDFTDDSGICASARRQHSMYLSTCGALWRLSAQCAPWPAEGETLGQRLAPERDFGVGRHDRRFVFSGCCASFLWMRD
jgi:hypothetical protein